MTDGQGRLRTARPATAAPWRADRDGGMRDRLEPARTRYTIRALLIDP
ncbi:hypothetical protein PYK79_29070 [Streptomyces sp. ID05-04B]|nr:MULTISPECIES: hypothetical protein [unclassified Streptomyces]MDX5566533.1 hypothetical protein [Streptomyces sp. ID05-04B]